ncbi:winged helix-turn-helix transcriptional regulator [Nocardia albiluteola]|nr:helix-turn-helix domain-containing protein [Nocardia albiluteola]
MGVDGEADHDVCGMSVAIDAVGGKWKLHLMWVLGAGPRRFGQIRRVLAGVSEKVLAENLRQMEARGIVHREIYPEVPPRVEYSLTAVGEELNTALRALGEWGDRHRDRLTTDQRDEITAAPGGPR